MDHDKPQFLGGHLGLPRHLQNLEPDQFQDIIEGSIDTIIKETDMLLKAFAQPWPVGGTRKWLQYRECQDKVQAVRDAIGVVQDCVGEVL